MTITSVIVTSIIVGGIGGCPSSVSVRLPVTEQAKGH